MVYIVSLLDRRTLLGASRKLDTIAGNFSYPIYLAHYPAGLLLVALGFTAAKRGQHLFFYAALPILLLLSWLMARFIERPMETIRRRMKSKPLDESNTRPEPDSHGAPVSKSTSRARQ